MWGHHLGVSPSTLLNRACNGVHQQFRLECFKLHMFGHGNRNGSTTNMLVIKSTRSLIFSGSSIKAVEVVIVVVVVVVVVAVVEVTAAGGLRDSGH